MVPLTICVFIEIGSQLTSPLTIVYCFMGIVISYRIFGIRSIKFKMYDGTVRALTEVRHVTRLRKNLIAMEFYILLAISLQFKVES